MAGSVRWLVTVLWLALLPTPLLSLGVPDPPEPADPALFGETIDVRVVNVEAVVTGSGGRRVRGLRAEDFRLLVDGREVPIDYFTEVEDGVTATPVPPASSTAVAPPALARGAVGRSVLIFVDQAMGVRNELGQVLHSLAGQLERLGDPDRLAVVTFDGHRLKVLCDWTGDRAAVRGALDMAAVAPASGIAVRAEQASLGHDADLFRSVQVALNDGDRTGLNVVPPPSIPWLAGANLRRTLRAAMAALRGLAGGGGTGRKAALLLSGSWPAWMSPDSYAGLIDTANRLGYTLYPVDVAGVESPSLPDDISMVQSINPGAPRTGFITTRWERDSQEGLEALAHWTGGTAALNSNRLAALGRLVKDTASYYWIGFTPAWRGDGLRHSVVLETRRPGLKVRARKDFIDLSQVVEDGLEIEGQQLLGTMEQERRLYVSFGPPRPAGRGLIDVPLTLGVPMEALSFVETGSGTQAMLAAAVASRQGKEESNLPPLGLQVALPAEPPADGLARFRTTLRLRSGTERIRFTVQDAAHDKLLWGEGQLVEP